MKVILPSYKILTPISEGGIKELQMIEQVGRTCYRSEDRITEDGESAKKFVANLIKNGHEAMIEFGDITVQFCVDRGITHELVRHRLCSFAQESTRYVNYQNDKYGNEITVILPNHFYKSDELEFVFDKNDNIKWPVLINHNFDKDNDFNIWYDACVRAEENYMKLIKGGVKPQVARSVLPNSTKAILNMKANYREWRNIFKLRADKLHAHPDMVYIMSRLLADMKLRIPVLFDDIYPEIQIEKEEKEDVLPNGKGLV